MKVEKASRCPALVVGSVRSFRTSSSVTLFPIPVYDLLIGTEVAVLDWDNLSSCGIDYNWGFVSPSVN